MGAVAARLHRSGEDFQDVRPNPLSVDGWGALVKKCAPRADEAAPGLSALIETEFAFLRLNWPKELPEGLIHADLFPDNVLFEGGKVSGVIDFYFACTDFFVYDLALTLNAWSAPGRSWSDEAAHAFIDAYQRDRPLTPAEKAALPVCLRGASLRILLTRLYDWLNRVAGAVVTVKDPLEYRDLLLFHRAGGPALTG
jgi:homoserine kinase type II